MRIRNIRLIAANIASLVVMSVTPVYAQNTDIKISKDDLNLPGSAPSGIGGDQVTAVLNIAYLVAGMTAVIVIIIGGVRYATSQGDSAGIQQAKNTILYAVVGLVVVLAAAAITNFVLQNIAK